MFSQIDLGADSEDEDETSTSHAKGSRSQASTLLHVERQTVSRDEQPLSEEQTKGTGTQQDSRSLPLTPSSRLTPDITTSDAASDSLAPVLQDILQEPQEASTSVSSLPGPNRSSLPSSYNSGSASEDVKPLEEQSSHKSSSGSSGTQRGGSEDVLIDDVSQLNGSQNQLPGVLTRDQILFDEDFQSFEEGQGRYNHRNVVSRFCGWGCDIESRHSPAHENGSGTDALVSPEPKHIKIM